MMKQRPPRLARWLFSLLCGQANIDDLLGDMDEMFVSNANKKSLTWARLIYWKQVFSLGFSDAIRKRKRLAEASPFASTGISVDMLRNFIKVAVRTIYQHKYFAALNVFGLAVGMSVSLLMISLISYVRTYDDFHTHGDNIYTITTNRMEGVDESIFASTPVVLADKLHEQFSEAQEVVRINSGFDEEVKLPQGSLLLSGYYVEPNFLDVFTYHVIQGDGRAALGKSNNLIITESAAMKLFNSTDVIGKSIELKRGELLEIGAVMKDPPINSHMKFDALVSYRTLPPVRKSTEDQWTSYRNQYVYVLLRDEAALPALRAFLEQASSETANFRVKVSYDLQSLHDISMGPDSRNAIGPKWEASGMIAFGIISLLILLPACFNYTNISIARALKRSKEIGLRKTMGGAKGQIFFQFITETVVITLVSLGGGVLIFFLIGSEFQSMLVESSTLDLSLTWKTVGSFILLAFMTGLVAGIFPALYFSRLNPIEALKSKMPSKGYSGMSIRKGLTVFQFALSFCFILSLIIFSRQYKYSLNFNFGFAKENIVDVKLQGVRPDLLKSEFTKLSSVQSISMSSGLIGLSSSPAWVHEHAGDSLEVYQLFVDAGFIPNFKLEFLAGGNFPNETWQRERFIIVNEEFIKAYKIDRPADALGRTFRVDGMELEVIGVLKNFHYAPLLVPIGKFFFRMDPAYFTYANLLVSTGDVYTTFSQFERTWQQLSTAPMAADFFENELKEGYSMYRGLLKIVGFLGLLAITISVLGMLGMVVYTTESRTKEVGVRKVMGASVGGLAYLLSKDYLKLMVWAILFSVPVMVVLFDQFLPRMQYYSVKLSPLDVVASTILLFGLGIGAIASQTFKTAQINPAETLKDQ